MPLTFTIAGLQAELDAFATAIKARDFALALDELTDYTATYHGLFESGALGDVNVKLPAPKELREQLEFARTLARQASTTNRVAHGRTNYLGGRL